MGSLKLSALRTVGSSEHLRSTAKKDCLQSQMSSRTVRFPVLFWFVSVSQPRPVYELIFQWHLEPAELSFVFHFPVVQCVCVCVGGSTFQVKCGMCVCF